jgi:hypothetical protein
MPRLPRYAWYFLLLALLTAVAIVTPIVYNLRQQLTREQVDAAAALWKAHGPADYDMLYAEKIDDEIRSSESRVKVRKGEVVELRVNGKLKDLEHISPEKLQEFTAEGMFAQIKKELEEDTAEGRRRNFATAYFDPKTGFPIHYVRRVRGTHTRLEWSARLLPPEEKTSAESIGER